MLCATIRLIILMSSSKSGPDPGYADHEIPFSQSGENVMFIETLNTRLVTIRLLEILVQQMYLNNNYPSYPRGLHLFPQGFASLHPMVISLPHMGFPSYDLHPFFTLFPCLHLALLLNG